jgi:hypothetical protein
MVEMHEEIRALNDRITKEAELVQRLTGEIGKVIVGQQLLIERLLVGLLANGHVLLEGVPGLAKTMSVEALSDAISAQFHRIQFTPDLLPADLIGTTIYRPQDGTFAVKKGPIFANIILADGLIICSPTGSTAYSLSAGGPMCEPGLELLVLTPICAHTFYSRPLVISSDHTIRVILKSSGEEAVLTVDGQRRYSLEEDDEVYVHKAASSVSMIKVNERSFYEILRNRLSRGVI